jgi:ABC-2 type transport system ATP-binding protein
MSTPYLDEAERCTRVALLHEGRVLAADEPARLRNTIAGPMVEVLAGRTADLERIRRLDNVRDVHAFGERLHVTLAAAPGSVDRFTAALQDTALRGAPVRPIAPSLEDAFIGMLEKQNAER